MLVASDIGGDINQSVKQINTGLWQQRVTSGVQIDENFVAAVESAGTKVLTPKRDATDYLDRVIRSVESASVVVDPSDNQPVGQRMENGNVICRSTFTDQGYPKDFITTTEIEVVVDSLEKGQKGYFV